MPDADESIKVASESIHFVGAQIALDLHAPSRSRLIAVLGMLALVGLQQMVGIALMFSMSNLGGSCVSHGDCGRAAYCASTVTPAWTGGPTFTYEFVSVIHSFPAHAADVLGTCRSCEAFDLPDPLDMRSVITEHRGEQWSTLKCTDRGLFGPWTAEAEAACEGCMHHGHFLHSYQLSVLNARSMHVMEWCALLFVALFVSLKVAAEARELTLLRLWVRRRKWPASPPSSAEEAFSSSAPTRSVAFARAALLFVCGLRHYVVLPCIVTVVPMFLLCDRADALSICLNALAALFVLDADNLLFSDGITDRHRRGTQPEQMLLSALDARRLARSHGMHMFATLFVALGAPAFVSIAGWQLRGDALAYIYFGLMFCALMLADELRLGELSWQDIRATLAVFVASMIVWLLVSSGIMINHIDARMNYAPGHLLSDGGRCRWLQTGTITEVPSSYVPDLCKDLWKDSMSIL